MLDNDELGLPSYIDDKPPEVGEKIETTDEIVINLATLDPMIDKIRIQVRCGTTFRLRELWHNGAVSISMQTPKGERDVIVYNPQLSGFNAIKIQNPVDIL